MSERMRGGEGGSRRRMFIYPERKRFPLRLPGGLYERLTAAAAAAGVPTTMLVAGILESALARPLSQRAALAIKDSGLSAGERLTLSMRLAPSLYAALKARSAGLGCSANNVACYYIDRAVEDREA